MQRVAVQAYASYNAFDVNGDAVPLTNWRVALPPKASQPSRGANRLKDGDEGHSFGLEDGC